MSVLFNTLVNLYRVLRNFWVRISRRPADFVWVPVTGDLPAFGSGKRGIIRRWLDPRSSTPSLESIRSQLDRLITDGRPRGVVLRMENLEAGWGALEELRAELHQFRSRGKRVVAYLIDGDTRAYYVASAADEIFVSPLSTLNVVGLRARVNFLKDTLKRLGLETEVLAVSPYKSAADPVSRTDFSPESRQQIERLFDRRFEELVDAISTGRNLTAERVRELIDRAPYSAAEAVEEGLLDGALYEDELSGRLGVEEPVKLEEWGTAKKKLRVAYRRGARKKLVGLVEVRGTIVRGKSRRLPVPLPLLGRMQAGSDSVVAALRLAEKSRRIGTILLHVNSPGGDALASDLIWREVERIRPKKPVVVLMGDAAASGGYYVSAAASSIFARRNTITGSIGVILTRPVAAILFERLDVHAVSIERGARANLLDPRLPPTRDELAVLNGQLDSFYTEFKKRVAAGRELEPGQLEEIAGGRVWTGAEAFEKGLVDEIGGFRTAMEKARELAGVPAGSTDVLIKVSPPGGARPTPGQPVQEAVEDVGRALSELHGTCLWALTPYEVTGGW